MNKNTELVKNLDPSVVADELVKVQPLNPLDVEKFAAALAEMERLYKETKR